MASSALCRVERYGHYSAHVDANRRQNSTHTQSMDEPLLARHALRDFSRPNDFTYPAWFAHFRDTVRFHRSPTAHRQERWRAANHCTQTAISCRILPDRDEDIERSRTACNHQHYAERDRKSDPV